jgi:hypothetical protein
MAKHGPENFTIRELRRVEYHSIIELQLIEEECIRDFGDLNTTYNSRSYEMAGLTLNRVIKERSPKERPIVVSKVPPREDVMEIACEVEEYPNKKISLDKFIGLFIPEEENYGTILDDMTIEGKIHLNRRVLEWFGYEGEYRKQKEAFLKILRRNSIEYHELTQKDKEIEQYPTIQEELQIVNKGAQTCTKFLIMAPNDLKMAIMQLKTKNGHIIRQYYIDLEELLKLYVEYTLYFNHRESQRKITDLEQMMARMDLTMKKQEKDREKDRQIMLRQEQYMRSLGISLEEVKDQNEELLEGNKGLKKQNKNIQRKLGIAVEDRAPQPEDHGPKDHDRDPAKPDRDESKRERFVLLKRNDSDYYPYYTIRAQDSYTTKKLKTQRTLFPDLVVLLDFKCSPNSKTLYNRIKENLKLKNVIFKNNDIDLQESEVTQQELIEEMKVINDQKYDV